MTVPNREEVKELVARLIFKYAHPDIKWGHLDNSLYRKETKTFEDKCIKVVEAILNLCYPCKECGGGDNSRNYGGSYLKCPVCKGTGQGEKTLAIVVESQELPECDLVKWDSVEQRDAYRNGWVHAVEALTTPQNGTKYVRVYTEE